MPWHEVQQHARQNQIAEEFAHSHIGQARPERQLEPACHSTQRVAHHGQPAHQAGGGAKAPKPVQRANFSGIATGLVHHLVSAQAHPPAHTTAQRVANSGHQDGHTYFSGGPRGGAAQPVLWCQRALSYAGLRHLRMACKGLLSYRGNHTVPRKIPKEEAACNVLNPTSSPAPPLWLARLLALAGCLWPWRY